MKIAIAKDNNQVSGHFGHCQGFQVYSLDNKKIVGDVFLENPGHVPGYLPKFLAENQVDVIVAGGMGGSAQQLFAGAGIDVIVGASGNIEDVINAFVEGKLLSSNATCKEHQHQGSCGEH